MSLLALQSCFPSWCGLYQLPRFIFSSLFRFLLNLILNECDCKAKNVVAVLPTHNVMGRVLEDN